MKHFYILFLISFQLLFSQQNGVVSFDLPSNNSLKFNKFLINPTFSFVKEDKSVFTLYNKRLWTDFENAPSTFLGSFSGKIGENNGVGLGFFQQKFGVLSSSGVVGNYARNILFSDESNFTFGLNIAAYKSGIDAGRVITNSIDPVLNNFPSNTILSITPAINYGTGFFDFGLAAKNIVFYNFQTSSLLQNDLGQGFDAHILYNGFLDYEGLLEEAKFSAIARAEVRKGNTALASTIMLNAPKAGWIQLGYNTVYGASGGLGVNVAQNFSVGITYEKAMGKIVDRGNALEFYLSYHFNKSEDDSNYSSPQTYTTPKVAPTIVAPTIAKSKEELDAQKAKQIADAKAESDALEAKKINDELKAKELADQKLIANALKAKQLEEAKNLKDIADAKAKEDALIKSIADQQRAKIAADAKAKQDAINAKQAQLDQQSRAIAAAKTKQLEDAQKAKLAADNLSRESAQKLKDAADAKAKIDAEAKAILDAKKVQDLADANAKGDLLKAKQLEDAQKLKDATDAKAKIDAEAKAILDAKKVQDLADAKAKGDLLKAKQVEEAQKLKDAADAKAKIDAEAKAILDAQKLKDLADAKAKQLEETKKLKDAADAKAKIDAEAKAILDAQKSKDLADAKAKQLEEAKKLKDATDAKAKIDAEAKAILDAQKSKDLADAKAKQLEDAQKLKDAADAKAKIDAEAKAILDAQKLKDLADAKAKGDLLKAKQLEDAQKLKDAADAKAKIDAEAKAILDAQKSKDLADAKAKQLEDAKKLKDASDAKAKIDAEAKAILDAQKSKDLADAKAKQLEDAKKQKDAADAKAKIDAEAKAILDAKKVQDLADAKAKQLEDAKKQKDAADAKAKIDAEAKAILDAQKLKDLADAKAKADLVKAKQLEDAKKLKDAADAKAKAEAQKIKDIADAKAKAEEERIKKEVEEAKIAATKDENDRSLDYLGQVVDDNTKNLAESISKLDSIAKSKQKDLTDLKEENDTGIIKEAKPFQSASIARKALESVKLEISEAAKSNQEFISQIENLLKERVKKIPNLLEANNIKYTKKIDALKAENLKLESLRTTIDSKIEKTLADLVVEKKRNIKKANKETGQDRYVKDRESLKILKLTTPKSGIEPKLEDLDFGDDENNMQILKKIDNTESGFYLILAVHKDEVKRDLFVSKLIAAGQTNVDYFFNVNTGKYFIYTNKYDDLILATRMLDQKGKKTFNSKMIIVKIEN